MHGDETRLEDVMTRQVVAVTPETLLEAVATVLHERKLSCTVVCEKERPIGIVSERDLVRVLGQLLRTPPTAPLRVTDVMSSPVLSMPADATVDEAVAYTRIHAIRRLPVVGEAGELVGIVTQTDLLRAVSARLAAQRDDLERMVIARTENLREANARLAALTVQDPLLGIGNRRSMELALAGAHARACRYDRPYSVALFDIDHFKRYNDSQGHRAGDDALRAVAMALRSAIRETDSVHRYGGEEILAVLHETGSDGMHQAAERARRAVEALALPHPESPHGVVTVSAGIACFEITPSHLASWAVVVKRADAALYRAKQAGRNRVAD